MTDYKNYFFKPSFGKTTVFEMYYEIYSSKNSNAVKQKYINMVLNMAKNINISSDTIDSIINDTNNYGKRIEDVKNWLSGTIKK